LRVRIRYYTTLRELAGAEEEEIELKGHPTFGDLVEVVSEMYGKEAYDYLHVFPGGEVDPAMKFLVNGQDVHRLRGFDTVLRDGDVVAFIPAIGGG